MLTQIKKRREIRFPGGKSKNGLHASFAIIYKKNELTGEIKVLVVPYFPNKIINKNVLTNNKMNIFPEDPQGTLVREIWEEINVDSQEFSLLGTFSVPDNTSKIKNLNHVKYVYAVTGYDDSRIRTQELVSEKIGIPYWLTLKELRIKLWPHHNWMLNFFEEFILDPAEYRPQEFSKPICV